MVDDNTLIARIISNGDQHAYATLIKKYQGPIRQFLRRLTTGEQATADDIAQEAFLRIYQKLDTFLGQSSFSTWAHKIAYNCFLKYKQKAYHQYEIDGFDFSILEAEIEDIERDLIIERLMNCLDIAERTCVTLSVSAGMSHQEISTITKFPLGTVKSHINRGKQKLIDKINQKL
ncbi:RNA polymerase sigma factor [Colwellia sp. BRX10-3]|uniref:RNA polymerase sigma factor n=1 Tax=Colwellia sp. BRX10-3 TaxID=2759844 RepID=UPI0015F579E6|nr:RNA polymerase sigma factor [Colwellia sp. BRX10-3]MBA6391840.1 RNA polymerase sigma factor [Colwellia sp. BRX10-3]